MFHTLVGKEKPLDLIHHSAVILNANVFTCQRRTYACFASGEIGFVFSNLAPLDVTGEIISYLTA